MARRSDKESYDPSLTNNGDDDNDDSADSGGDNDDEVSQLEADQQPAVPCRESHCPCNGCCPCNRLPNPVPGAGESMPIKLLRQFGEISAVIGQKFAAQSVEFPKLLMYSGITLATIILLISVVPIRMLTALLYGLLIVIFLTYLVIALYQTGVDARRKRPNPEPTVHPQPIQKHKLKAWRESVAKLR